jgi:Restriction endonuclease XhoI
MLEEDEKSLRPTKRTSLSPFEVDEEFQLRSYAKRYELVCERLVRERLYDAACFSTSNAKSGMQSVFSQPNLELSIRNFAISLHARAAAFAKLT